MPLSAYMILGSLVLFAAALAIGKVQYEKHPEWFEDK